VLVKERVVAFEDPRSVKKYFKVAIQGGKKVGKTRAALSFPNPLVVDGEHGTDPYRKKYEYKVRHTNTWTGLGEEVNALAARPIVGATLIIDPITVFYKALIDGLVQEVKKKRGHEIMSQSEWGIEGRRWFAFLNMLVALPMHVVLVTREKEEYVESVNHRGEEVRRKTGQFLMECDKQTEYLFDFILRIRAEGDRKKKERRHILSVEGTRYDSVLPLYSEYDITGKRVFAELFEPHLAELLDADEEPVAEPNSEPFVIVDESQKTATAAASNPSSSSALADNPSDPATEAASEPLERDNRGTVDRVGEALDKFTGPGDQDAPLATLEDIKLLMTRCGELTWPDGSSFKSSDGKTLLKALYKIESTKELKKYQCEFLEREFAEVLAGRAVLERDETGTPFVRRLSGVTVPK
jgi:hypothetical protein